MPSQTYQTASRQLLRQGCDALARGDVRQASGKGWGAAAQMVKAIAEQRGWPHQGHADLYNAISRLVSETGDEDIGQLFNVAGNLDSNFYEGWNNAANVGRALNDMERFLDKLDSLGPAS